VIEVPGPGIKSSIIGQSFRRTKREKQIRKIEWISQVQVSVTIRVKLFNKTVIKWKISTGLIYNWDAYIQIIGT